MIFKDSVDALPALTAEGRCRSRAREHVARWFVSSLMLLAVACSDDTAEPTPDEEDAGDAGPSADAGPDAEKNPAVLLAVNVEGPGGSRSVYVGAVPEVPTGKVDYSNFLEFANVDVSTHGGYVFVWDREPATIQRLTVNEDLSLTSEPDQTISFANFGTAGGGHIVYVSNTRAYMMSSQLDEIVVWNPQAMEITGTIQVELPDELAAFPEVFPHSGMVVGDSVIWQINAQDRETSTIYPGVVLAVVDAKTDAPVKFVHDARCAGTDGGHVDENGDYYVRAGAFWGYFAAFGDDAKSVTTCLLRIRAGASTFDPAFMLDMEELTGSSVNFPWIHVQGSHYLAQAWDPDRPFPADPNDFWYSDLVPLLVDIEDGTAKPYPDIDGTIMVTSAEFKVDDASYYVLSEEGYQVGGSVDVVQLTPDGIVHKFTVPELWALARIR